MNRLIITTSCLLLAFICGCRDKKPTADDYNNQGMALSKKGEYDKAITAYSESIRLDQKSAIAYYNRGDARYRKGDTTKALSDFDEAIRLDPKDPISYCTRGSVWSVIGEFDKAIIDYSEAIRLDPNYVTALYLRGVSWNAKGEYGKAIDEYKKTIQLNSEFFQAYNNIAWLQATCPDAQYRDGPKAVENATTACELLDWKDEITIDTLAAAYAENGEFDEAIKWLKKAMELAPESNADHKKMLIAFQASKPYREQPQK